jgi:hypothetical protein
LALPTWRLGFSQAYGIEYGTEIAPVAAHGAFDAGFELFDFMPLLGLEGSEQGSIVALVLLPWRMGRMMCARTVPAFGRVEGCTVMGVNWSVHRSFVGRPALPQEDNELPSFARLPGRPRKKRECGVSRTPIGTYDADSLLFRLPSTSYSFLLRCSLHF